MENVDQLRQTASRVERVAALIQAARDSLGALIREAQAAGDDGQAIAIAQLSLHIARATREYRMRQASAPPCCAGQAGMGLLPARRFFVGFTSLPAQHGAAEGRGGRISPRRAP